MRKVSFTGCYIALTVGALSCFSGSAQKPPNPVFASTGGLIFIAAIAYLARKKQKSGASKWWLTLEVPALVAFALVNVNSLINARWYSHPIPFLIVPIYSVVAYIIMLLTSDTRDTDVETPQAI